MNDMFGLHPVPTKDDFEFVTDMARFAEGNASEADIKRKYRFGDEVWTRLGDDDELVRSIEAEKTRRIRSGATKRERAQQLVVKGPAILDSIASDARASPRHRVDALKTLDTMATGGSQNGPAADPSRFVIRIDLTAGGCDMLTFNKSIAPDPNDIDPGADDVKPDKPVAIGASDDEYDADDNIFAAAIHAAKKMQGGGSGQPV